MEEIRKRIVMIPAPFEGHFPPLMNLASNLSSKGFSITVIRTQFNFHDISDRFPDFEFLIIPDGLSESDKSSLGLVDLILKLNSACGPLLKDLLTVRDDVSCIVYDEFLYFPRSVAEDLNLPKMVFSASCAATSISRCVLMGLVENGLLPPQESKFRQEEIVPGFHPFRFRDLPTTEYGSMDKLMTLYDNVSNRNTCSGIIHNTSYCLESSCILLALEKWKVPVYHVGPLHKTAFATLIPSSFPEERSCIEWLNKQKPNSVIYISMGSLAIVEEEEVMEMAMGLMQSKQPFLWVIRPSSIPGFKSIDSFPDAFKETIEVERRGFVVKWAPQKEVIEHGSVGGIWSHCGWNSTLESVCSGVPVICRPYSGDQRVNTRLMTQIWRIGFEVGGKLERGLVERAVKKLMLEQEGEEMRKRAITLKEKIHASVRFGGSSHESLNDLACSIMSLPSPSS
ncbi:PREDICTED: UDP-glycosyltransferase 76D1 [Tarenaya hassleriana]|uniref:UDP-glycosyltransferase 76D1 n=1 Tax=Tarenaya hassleriana TaxID=28532 RepID=UPI00053C435D|nr:PREDICTED: UDP-glycosyltransferase 76D1 [Tarenaya hassleriana]